jgi:hypothetical protein
MMCRFNPKRDRDVNIFFLRNDWFSLARWRYSNREPAFLQDSI